MTLVLVFVGVTLPIAFGIETFEPVENRVTAGSIQNNKSTIVEYQLLRSGKTATGARYHQFQPVEIARLRNESRILTVAEWTLELLESGEALDTFLDVLRYSPFDAFYFETRPVNPRSFSQKETNIVLVDAPELYKFTQSRQANFRKFKEPFATCIENQLKNSDTDTTQQDQETHLACAFSSVQRDTKLISPLPATMLPADKTTVLTTSNALRSANHTTTKALTHHAHLAEFCRHAPSSTVTHTWRLALQTYRSTVSATPDRGSKTQNTWFSTAGLEAPWVHFRVEHRPRYYSYNPFRDEE